MVVYLILNRCGSKHFVILYGIIIVLRFMKFEEISVIYSEDYYESVLTMSTYVISTETSLLCSIHSVRCNIILFYYCMFLDIYRFELIKAEKPVINVYVKVLVLNINFFTTCKV